MGWITSLLQNREVHRLEDLARTAPAPSVFLRLNLLYEEEGEREKAREAIARGLALFPDDPRLRDETAGQERAALQLEIQQLAARIDRFPNPSLYAKLASLHLKNGRLQECVEVCRASQKSFPRYGGTYLLLAQVALREDRRHEAFEHLKRATELDRYNYQALVLLAEEHMRRGEPGEGRQCLESILSFAPADPKVSSMLQEYDEIAARLHGEAKKAEQGKASTRMERLSNLAEAQPPAFDAFGMPAAAEGAKPADSYSAAVDELAAVDGVAGCLVTDEHGLVVASRLAPGLDEELTAALVASVFRASADSAPAFGLGSFEEGILESPDGGIYILNLKDMAATVLAEAGAKPGLLQRALHAFAEKATSH